MIYEILTYKIQLYPNKTLTISSRGSTSNARYPVFSDVRGFEHVAIAKLQGYVLRSAIQIPSEGLVCIVSITQAVHIHVLEDGDLDVSYSLIDTDFFINTIDEKNRGYF